MPIKKIKKGYRKTRYILYKETLIDFKEHFWAFVGSFIGIGSIAYFNSHNFVGSDAVFLIGSFGASSVLIYGIIQSPFSQPRNLIGGHLISAFVGVTVQLLLPDIIWLSSALAVSLSIVLMQVTRTLHPPGGTTALIAVISSDKIKDLGYWYVLSPILTGVLILLFVALVVNNLTESRSYPTNNKYHKKYHTFRKRITKKLQA
ncbi:HPP family protein [Flavobacterium degerlachei]|jgi:CBS-domain-containing membrane protein|uniref:HPP family protein n=1 Tax=Flavobacterium degerlachei TaxID=229203 RepID=A0A1H3A9E6_9FLAO|nr:HPP family protein [Flavobacterium degerlachei]SDX26337.1 HPP family protein [Flavobacterium degerlachei]